MLSKPLNQPLAQGNRRSNGPGGRVDLEEKNRIDNILILLETDGILKVLREPCG
jgi:hypothetical protein